MPPAEIENEQMADHRRHRAKLHAALAREAWLIPDKVVRRLSQMEADIDERPPSGMWSDLVFDGFKAMQAAVGDIKALARTDLDMRG